jgi:hypothetical protein
MLGNPPRRQTTRRWRDPTVRPRQTSDVANAGEGFPNLAPVKLVAEPSPTRVVRHPRALSGTKTFAKTGLTNSLASASM